MKTGDSIKCVGFDCVTLLHVTALDSSGPSPAKPLETVRMPATKKPKSYSVYEIRRGRAPLLMLVTTDLKEAKALCQDCYSQRVSGFGHYAVLDQHEREVFRVPPAT